MLQKFNSLSTRPKLVLIGNFGATNIGDEFILAGFLQKIRTTIPRAQITILSANLRESRRWHSRNNFAKVLPTGLRSFFSGGLFATLRAFKNSDAVIFPGGGLFTDEESWRAIFLWGVHILVARWFWKPVYLFGQSIGPFRTEWGRSFARLVLAKTELIHVRDTASAQELLTLGIVKNKIQRGEDSALFLATSKKTQNSRKKNRCQRVLVSVRNYPHLPENFFQKIAQRLDELSVKQKAEIIFVPFETGSHDDHDTWQKVCALAKNFARWKTAAMPYGVKNALAFIQTFDLVIGMRLHSLILAKIANVPTMPFAYSRKVNEWEKNLKCRLNGKFGGLKTQRFGIMKA